MLPILKTPSEFIDFYFRQLKTSMDSNNFKLMKTGFIGFFLNILGNVQFDVKQYYDSLFNEAFPATALDNTNLRFHSALYNYVTGFASSASITSGKFNLNLNELPIIHSGLISRTISIGATDVVVGSRLRLGIDTNGVIFTIKDIYNLKAKVVGGNIISYFLETISNSAHINSFVDLDNPAIQITTGSQESVIQHTISVPYYIPGTHYSITIPILNALVSNITISVLNKLTNTTSNFLLSDNKTIHGPTENIIFYIFNPDNSLTLELGSGVNGTYIPNGSILNVSISVTDGSKGNILPSSNTEQLISKDAQFEQTTTVIDTYGPNNVISTIVDIHKLLSPVIESASGGVDILSGNDLRIGLLTFIQSSDHLLTTLDYDNYLKTIFDQHYVSFNKTLLASNTMNVHVSLLNKQSLPYATDTVTIPRQIFEISRYVSPTNEIILYEPHMIVNSVDTVSPFYYKYDSLLRSYRASTLEGETTFNYTSITNVDGLGVPVTSNLPYVHTTLIYHHNTIAPFTIISLRSYENILKYAISPSSAQIKVANPPITLLTNTPSHIVPISKKSGIISTLSTAVNTIITTIAVVDVNVFPISGSVLIDSEELSYSGRNISTNTLIGVTRGINGTVAANHLISSIVYDLSLANDTIDFIFGVIASTITVPMLSTDITMLVVDTTYFPASGTVIIDTEEISYTSKTTTNLNGLTRGVNATIAAAHTLGSIVFELTTHSAAIANPNLFLGIIPTATPIEVVLDNLTVTGGTSATCAFNVFQLKDISDFLSIKEFIQISTAIATITAPITTLSNIFPITSTSSFSASGGFANIGTEYISYSGIFAGSLTGVFRGLNGSVPAGYSIGERISPMTIDELSVPVISFSQYTADMLFIDNQMKTTLGLLTVPVNRPITDEVQIKFLNTSSLSLTYTNNVVVNGGLYTSGILFPLKVNVVLLINTQTLISTGADITADIVSLKNVIATELLSKYTGIQIRISNADIVAISKTIPYVDDADVAFTDSSVVPVQIPQNEINVNADHDILLGLTKTDRLGFVPPLWYWDVNNINVTYSVQ